MLVGDFHQGSEVLLADMKANWRAWECGKKTVLKWGTGAAVLSEASVRETLSPQSRRSSKLPASVSLSSRCS